MKANRISLLLFVVCLFSVVSGSAANHTRRYNPNAKSPLLDLSLEKRLELARKYIKFDYYEHNPFVEVLGAETEKWGLIDFYGNEVAPCMYDYIFDFYDGYASVKLNGKYGFIDKEAKEVVPCIYDDVSRFDNGLASVCLNGKWGVINGEGNEVIACVYNTELIFSDGLALADRSGKYGYIDMLIAYEMDDKIDNLHQFINQMKTYFKQEDASLSEFVSNVTLMSSQDEMDDKDNSDYVKLMTIHTAKGLEFNNVFIYGLVEQVFPSSRTITESEDGLEEERRLFYVAITRAKKRLYLSTSGGFSYMGPRRPSRFLREIKQTAMEEKVVIRNDNLKQFSPTNIRAGSVIKHDIFGEGIVLSERDGIIDVVFKDPRFARKTLNASHKFVHLIK